MGVSRTLLLCCSLAPVDIIETLNCRYEPDSMSSNDHVIILHNLWNELRKIFLKLSNRLSSETVKSCSMSPDRQSPLMLMQLVRGRGMIFLERLFISQILLPRGCSTNTDCRGSASVTLLVSEPFHQQNRNLAALDRCKSPAECNCAISSEIPSDSQSPSVR